MPTNKIPHNKYKRVFSWLWRQKSRTQNCPITPSLKGKIVAITGGTRGIGLETVKGLLARDAEVIILSRNKKKDKNTIRELRGKAYFVSLDLANIKSIRNTIDNLKDVLMDRKIDILINNAGIALKGKRQTSPQGYELTYAVNVLGHHILFQECHSKFLLNYNAQIIAVTGDIYFFANECTSDFTYEGTNGMDAYCRSKLGVMWWAHECTKSYPQYKINLVHPGLIPMGLGANSKSIIVRILSKILLSPKEGAQTTLVCASQAGIESGAYYHNVFGKTELPNNDPALDYKASTIFWNEIQKIYINDFKNDFSLARTFYS